MIEIGVIVLIIIGICILGVSIVNLIRKPDAQNLDLPLQSLTQTLQEVKTTTVSLNEKTIGLTENMSSLGKAFGETNQSVLHIRDGLAETSAKTQGLLLAVDSISTELSHSKSSVVSLRTYVEGQMMTLADNTAQSNAELSNAKANLAALRTYVETHSDTMTATTSTIRNSLADTRTNLVELKTYVESRSDIQDRAAKSLQRLESIIAGTQSKGAAGENIVENIFANFPPEWQVRDFKIKNQTCEFGLRLNNGLVLPIDSKWAATQLIDDFAQCQDEAEKIKIKHGIKGKIIEKAKEVQKYIDPDQTVGFGVAVVPDAAYDICGAAVSDSFKLNVVIVSYSMFVPYLMLVFHTMLKSAQTIDVEKLGRKLQDAETCVDKIQGELDGRYSSGLKQIQNAQIEMSNQLGRLRTNISGIRVLEPAATPTLD